MGASGGSNGVQVHKGNFPGTIASQLLDDGADYSLCQVHSFSVAHCVVPTLLVLSAAVLSSGRSRSLGPQTQVSQNYTNLF